MHQINCRMQTLTTIAAVMHMGHTILLHRCGFQAAEPAAELLSGTAAFDASVAKQQARARSAYIWLDAPLEMILEALKDRDSA